MKKHLLILAIVTATVFATATAQIQRGYYLIGGNLSNISLGLSNGNPFTLNITPKVAWFTSDNLAVGGFVDIGLSSANDMTVFNYGVGPLARYYFGSTDVSTTTTSARRSSRFFVEGTVGLQGVNVSDGGGSTNGLGIGIGPGLAYFVNQNIALEGLLKYTKAFGFGSDGGSSLLQLGIGFQIYLPRGTIRNQVNKVSQ